MNDQGAKDRMFTMGLFAWLSRVEDDAERLTEGGQVALMLLREDLERLAQSE